MADKTEPDPQPTGGEPNAGDPPDAEQAFWDKLDKRIDAGIGRAIGEWKKAQPTGTSRTGGGRTSLPSILADLVFGPPKGDG